jgi:septal ring factor EnvC (AmiA/AmiB activator)
VKPKAIAGTAGSHKEQAAKAKEQAAKAKEQAAKAKEQAAKAKEQAAKAKEQAAKANEQAAKALPACGNPRFLLTMRGWLSPKEGLLASPHVAGGCHPRKGCIHKESPCVIMKLCSWSTRTRANRCLP